MYGNFGSKCGIVRKRVIKSTPGGGDGDFREDYP